MSEYIDGFVFPISRNRLGEYKELAEATAEIWKQHGALSYREFVADDLTLAGTRSFSDAIDAEEDEVIIFGWVEFKSREDRDLANQKVASDPKMEKLMNSSNSDFNPERMAYAGFKSLATL